MLGPLTIVSLDQGKLYGTSTKPEQALWWEAAAPDTELQTPEVASIEPRAAWLQALLCATRSLLARSMRGNSPDAKISRSA